MEQRNVAALTGWEYGVVSRLQLFPNLLNIIEKHFLVLFFFFFFSQPLFSCRATHTYQSSLGWVTWANSWIFWFVIFTVQLFSYENLLLISGDVKGTTLLLLRKKVILKSFSLRNMKQTSKHVDVSLRTDSKKKIKSEYRKSSIKPPSLISSPPLPFHVKRVFLLPLSF